MASVVAALDPREARMPEKMLFPCPQGAEPTGRFVRDLARVTAANEKVRMTGTEPSSGIL